MKRAVLLPVARQALCGFPEGTSVDVAGRAGLFRWNLAVENEKSVYTAFGFPYSPATQISEGLTQRYTFQGREASANAGAPMYYRNRMYATGLGRFGRRDPALGGDSLYNGYVFPTNNPAMSVDALGLGGATGSWSEGADTAAAKEAAARYKFKFFMPGKDGKGYYSIVLPSDRDVCSMRLAVEGRDIPEATLTPEQGARKFARGQLLFPKFDYEWIARNEYSKVGHPGGIPLDLSFRFTVSKDKGDRLTTTEFRHVDVHVEHLRYQEFAESGVLWSANSGPKPGAPTPLEPTRGPAGQVINPSRAGTAAAGGGALVAGYLLSRTKANVEGKGAYTLYRIEDNKGGDVDSPIVEHHGDKYGKWETDLQVSTNWTFSHDMWTGTGGRAAAGIYAFDDPITGTRVGFRQQPVRIEGGPPRETVQPPGSIRGEHLYSGKITWILRYEGVWFYTMESMNTQLRMKTLFVGDPSSVTQSVLISEEGAYLKLPGEPWDYAPGRTAAKPKK